MMRPPPFSTRCGATARMALQVPVRLTSMVSCQSASSQSRIGLNAWMPAFANRMSSLPKVARAFSAAARQSGKIALVKARFAPACPCGFNQTARLRQFVARRWHDLKRRADWPGNVDAHHIGALAGKGYCRRAPDTAGGASDNGSLASQPSETCSALRFLDCLCHDLFSVFTRGTK